jgi:hypothetical protein
MKERVYNEIGDEINRFHQVTSHQHDSKWCWNALETTVMLVKLLPLLYKHSPFSFTLHPSFVARYLNANT